MDQFRSPIKVILARLSGAASDQSVLACAALVAKAFRAHVKALHVRLEPASLPLLAGSETGRFRGFGDSPEALSDHLAEAARQTYDGWTNANGFRQITEPETGDEPTSEWIDYYGSEPELLVEYGRLSDLIVIARPDPDQGMLSQASLEAALFDSERPVLVVPEKADDGALSNPVFAWNGSPQATRSLAAGLPLMQASADEVAILTVPERDVAADADDVVRYLGWHGVRAKAVAPTAAPAGEQLSGLVRDRGGFLICGAYSRSRFRQMIFGGVTSHLLDSADFAVLMSN